MTLAITVNNADYSSNSIGWEAPTTVQPASALFALNNAASLKNLAASSRQPTAVKGSPVFTAGVSGGSLPFETLGSSGRIETYTTLPQKSTIISLLRMGSGQANVMSMSIATPSFQILQRSGEWNNWVVCGGGSDQITVNAALTAGTWQICAWQCDLSSKTPVLSIDNYTTGVTASNTGNFAQVYTPTQTINLGDSGDSAAASTYDLATFLVWSDILSADDQAAAVSWLRQYAASYGVSA